MSILMSLVHEDGVTRMIAPIQPDLRLLFVPKGSCEILHTWRVGGLRGSGSHDVVVADVFVPVEDSCSPTSRHPALGSLPQGLTSIAAWRQCGTTSDTNFRRPRTVPGYTVRVSKQPPLGVQASWPCTPPLVLRRSIVTVHWNRAYAICTRWRGTLLRNRCGWMMRGECCWDMHRRIHYF
jgi:hypothetical protein